MAYPATIDSFTNPSGTNTVDQVDHALQHTNHNTAIVSIENVVGTTSGTFIAKNMQAGEFPVRNTGGGATGTLVQTLVGGTLNTNTITNGTMNNEVMGTPAITGGTANSITLGTPVFVGVLNNYAYNALANYTTSSTSFASVDAINLTKILATTGGKVRIMFSSTLTNNAAGNQIQFKIIRNPAGTPGTVCFSDELVFNANEYRMITMLAIDSPSAGNNTYDVQWQTQAGTALLGNNSFYVNFSLEEIKAG